MYQPVFVTKIIIVLARILITLIKEKVYQVFYLYYYLTISSKMMAMYGGIVVRRISLHKKPLVRQD